MKRIHPNIARIAYLAMLAFLIGPIGCRTPSGGVANPFLAPDRVPPPATRAILPGQAQPYYPGDPLPVMQSSTAPEDEPTNSGLAWGARGMTAAPSTAAPNSGSLASSNEKVAIPTDESDLRFEASRHDASAELASSGRGPAATPANDTAATHAVVAASFDAPVKSELPTSSPDVKLVDAEVVSPWRSPQIGQSVASVPAVASPPRVAIPGGEPSGMGVRMRGVPSPMPTPSESATPRIRLPGYYVPLSYSSAAMPPGTVVYAAPVMQSAGSAPQPVQPNPLSLAVVPPGPASQDGFRPRTAMR
jgi:hypothetical protein